MKSKIRSYNSSIAGLCLNMPFDNSTFSTFIAAFIGMALRRLALPIIGLMACSFCLAGVNLGLSSGSATPGTTISLDIALTAALSDPPASVEWTINYSTSDFSSVNVQLGPSGISANKSVSCTNTPGTKTCVLYGFNSTPLSNGVVATVGLTVSSSTTSSSSLVQLSQGSAADAVGISLTTSTVGSTIGINPPALNGLFCNPISLASQASAVCSVALTAAARSGGALISLASSAAALNVPSSVTIPQGSSSTTFSVTAGVVTTLTPVTVTATFAGVSETSLLSINPPIPTLSGISITPSSIASGQSGAGTVSLTSPAGAGGALVSLVSSNPSAASVPPTVTVAAGAISASFSVNAATVTASTSLVLTASYGGASTTASVTINPPAPDFTLSASPSSRTVLQGGSTTYSVIISPMGGFTGQVSLSMNGLPTGANGSFTPNPATASSTLSVTTNLSTPAGTYTFTITGVSGTLTRTTTLSLTAASNPPSGAAAFVKTDSTTGGSWKGVYGADGYNIVNDTASYPAYVSAAASGNSSYTWVNSTTDTRALQKASSTTGRIAACWYSFGAFNIDLQFNDSKTHQVALYLLDWDNYNGRSERVDILDSNNNLLDSRSASGFVGGQYLVWNLSGHVVVRITNTNGASNGALSGLLFGPGGAIPPTNAAAFVKTDSTTGGSWKGVYGADGYNIVNDTASYPAYVSAAASGNSSYTWVNSTTDTRALQKASSTTGRIAACWYSFGALNIDLQFNDSNAHQVALYLLDWDNYNGRSERVDILDSNGNLLDSRSAANFVGGQYLVWNLSGHVIVRITNTNGASNGVLSGLLFGPASAIPPANAAAFVKTDSTTGGSWKGVYGADGYNIVSDTASYPAYVSAAASGNSSYTWVNSTTDTRALQKASSTTDRIAACWYSFGAFNIDLQFNDSNTHQVALYLLDWDNYNGRSERVDILDSNGNLLDSRSAASFVGGQYLVWNLSGHVIVRITNTNGASNGVLSGILFR
jgi:hypothetical protein